MPNTLSIRITHLDRADEVRLCIEIDGEEKFELEEQILEESFLSPAPPPVHSTIALFRKSDLDRIISYGFCDELCCPSTLAKVQIEGELVIWSDIRYTSSDKIINPTRFEFNRAEYEAEIKRALIALPLYIQNLREKSDNRILPNNAT
jgi:hypothetical protein